MHQGEVRSRAQNVAEHKSESRDKNSNSSGLPRFATTPREIQQERQAQQSYANAFSLRADPDAGGRTVENRSVRQSAHFSQKEAIAFQHPSWEDQEGFERVKSILQEIEKSMHQGEARSRAQNVAKHRSVSRSKHSNSSGSPRFRTTSRELFTSAPSPTILRKHFFAPS